MTGRPRRVSVPFRRASANTIPPPTAEVWRIVQPRPCAIEGCQEQTTRLLVFYQPRYRGEAERAWRVRDRLALCATCALARYGVLYEEGEDELRSQDANSM